MSIIFLFFLILSLSPSASLGSNTNNEATTKQLNPFTHRASLIRYWDTHVSNHLPIPTFLFSKSSTLNPVDSAILTKLAAQNSLPSHFTSFCSLANLYCSFDASSQSDQLLTSRSKGSNFAGYANKNFATYGTSQLGGADSFKNYSGDLNSPHDSFTKYSKTSRSHSEHFTSYAHDANVANDTFTNYAAGAVAGSGDFNSYHDHVNVPNLRFASYDSGSSNHKLSFTAYSDDTNAGAETFISYGKNGNANPNEFNSYAGNANIVGSGFTGYGESGKAANDSFKGYGLNGNNPHSNFKSYGAGGKSGIDSFSSYRNGANVGDDSFLSYAKNANSGKVTFSNYGKSFNLGNDSFKEYGAGSTGRTSVGFKSYSLGRSFKEYAKNGVTFAQYNNFTTVAADSEEKSGSSGSSVNRWVEPGKFFRESMLKQGNVMVMPDIKDKMPERSFLPRTILSKLPFSTSRMSELKELFHVGDNSATERVITNTLTECERAPSPGETKYCVGSVEDMIDFSVSVLGHNVVVRTTENVRGSKKNVMIGKVIGINGGRVTESVSCHQSLYPYLLYYCHSVPKVRVYEADIVDVESRNKINHAVAICHLDTSAWSPGHGAFVALGSSPGNTEVCHWIFENDMTWTVADN
ncbi:PREDICTED: probable polygalacturonase non-catalytic subunit JP650 [Fragaria vesca subsp. vesca]|uniref:probable polygalacturonase non-catalytic subunit JP650 n=1 Tax=Fragaria vesca subsp. vesca TaxID=101020 RepID=UPI0002C2E985|nr:PREDICTED: probable polygalacturonase non-catalytic subunit JP650 [Fragaria vesca subsp. vesca]